MEYVLLSIATEIVQLFHSWEKVFILNGKSYHIQDPFSNLMDHWFRISAKEVVFKKEMGEVGLGKKDFDVFQLLTVSQIFPYLDVCLPDKDSDEGIMVDVKDLSTKHDYLYSIEEYEKVLDLMYDRMEKIYTQYLDIVEEDEEMNQLYINITNIFE
mmetsp:Transcript_19685/g.17400  ORF Transcript_19685/g.17400 Transcript_19685/m.17400 type:complete len:156 (+) Transcript_19685:104-571(+)